MTAFLTFPCISATSSEIRKEKAEHISIRNLHRRLAMKFWGKKRELSMMSKIDNVFTKRKTSSAPLKRKIICRGGT